MIGHGNPAVRFTSYLKMIFQVMTAVLVLLWGSGCVGTVKTRPAEGATAYTEEIASLKQRIQMLEDKEAVLSLLSRYSLTIDLGRAEAFLALFTEDCVFATDVAGKLMFRRGKQELGEMIATRPPKGQHLQLDYTVRVEGDTATAVGYQELTGLKDKAVTLNRAAYRVLTFRRVSGCWYIHEVYTIGLDNESEFLKVLPEGVL